MTAYEKIKTINNKVEPNKAQYSLDRQTAKIFALSTENVTKYEVLACGNILPEIKILEKAATIIKFEYLSLGSDFKKQTDIAKDQSKLFKDQINYDSYY